MRSRLVLIATLLCSLTQTQNVNSEIYDDFSEKFESIMETEGFLIANGKMVMHSAESCEDFESGLCSGNDPFDSFGTYDIPAVVNEYTDDLDKYEHRLSPTEAVVAFCKTPSGPDYFSYTHFLSKRVFLARSKSIYASLSDSLNPDTINVKRADDSYEAAFGKDFVIITTASEETLQTVFSALKESGVSEEIMNLQVISTDVVQLGLSRDKDVIGFKHFVIGEASEDYMSDPKCEIVRLTPITNSRSGVQAYKPLAAPTRASKESGYDEKYLTRTLNKMERFIKKAHVAKYQSITAKTVLQSRDPETCLSKAKPCSGDNSDFTEYLNLSGVTLHTNKFFVLYGVNHVETGFATIQSIRVSDMNDNSLGSINVGDELFNSAAVYMTNEYNDKLFAVVVARDCTNFEHCVEVPADDVLSGAMFSPIKFLETLVLNPKTGTGPSEEEILPFKVVYGEMMAIARNIGN